MLLPTLLLLCAINACYGQKPNSAAIDWIERGENGAYRFGYQTNDEGGHYHAASATADNTVAGKFGYKDPATGGDLQTTYTAGRRGFRARGPHIARRMDLSQNKPPFSRPNNDGKYHPELDNVFDPTEDRGYDFAFQSPDQVKEEHANSIGDVQGRYSYLDDVGIKHNVDYIAGSRTGFQVTNPVPDTFAQAQGGPLYFVGKNPNPKARGYSAVQKGLDGSYRFVSSGPDQKRSEVSDALGNRRGTYSYLDDKGQQHTVEYIAGPNIGFKVINNRKGMIYPFYPDISTLTPGPTPSVPTFGSSTPSNIPSGVYPSGASPTGGSPSGLPPTDLSPGLKPTGLPDSPLGTDITTGSGLGGDGPGGLGSTPGSGTSGPGSSTPSYGGGLSPTSPPLSTGGLFPSPTPGSPGPTRPPPSSIPSFGSLDPNDKWNYDDLFNKQPPLIIPPKDWSKHTNFQADTKVTFGKPSSTPFPAYDPFLDIPNPNFPDDFAILHHQLFPEGLNTAETGAGLKPFRPSGGSSGGLNGNGHHTHDHDCRNDSHSNSIPENPYQRPVGDDVGAGGYRPPIKNPKPHVNVYRGDVKFGGVKKTGYKSRDDDYFRIPTGIAVRAHVQSLDIVPYSKRFVSPGEAIERYGSHERRQ